jgi:hypothetical protein
MNKKAMEKNLFKVLLGDGAMASQLFEHELEEHRNEFLKSKHEDHDDYFFAVTGRAKDVAMLLIDGEDNVHANENARALLKVLWPQSAYKHNMQILIPQIADELYKGYIFVTGVKVQKG